MPSGKYEVWADDEHQQSYNAKDEALAHARRLAESGDFKRVQLWDLTHTRIGVKRLGNRITDPRLVDLRKPGVHFSGGRARNHGS